MPAAEVASHVADHGSVVGVAITAPSTTNCTLATGPTVCAPHVTTPLSVAPSAIVCDTILIGFAGFGAGAFFGAILGVIAWL